MRHRFLRSTKVYLTYLTLCFAILFVLRALFYITFSWAAKGASSHDLAYAVFLGAKFDMRLAALMSLPLGFFLILPRIDCLNYKTTAKILKLLLTAIFALVLSVYFFDFGFYSYMETRLSYAGLKFFDNPLISLQMLNESYPLGWILLGYIVLVCGFYFAIRFVLGLYQSNTTPPTRKQKSFDFLFCFLLTALIIYGKIGQYSLRWSEAYFSTHPFVTNFTLNPVLYLYETSNYAKQDFDIAKTKKYYHQVAGYLGVNDPDPKRLNYTRKITSQPTSPQLNVVIILLESLAADKTSMFGNKLDPTPFLASISKQSLLFKNCFTPTEATARGVFALVTGIPDVSLVRTSTKNPFAVNQNTIVNQFTDYEKFYFMGGSANWVNIRGIISHNIDGVHLFEEDDYDSPKNDVWGISDLDLLKEAHTKFAAQTKPFISIIQTAGFHRPYTIPKNNDGFELANVDLPTLQENGFHSLEQFNSLRFEDYAVKKFMELAKEANYFENTVFIMLGDHGLPAVKAPNASEGFLFYKLIAHHTPLIFYSPKWVKPGVSTEVVSQIDVVATAASLTGQSYINTTLGRDIMSLDKDLPSYAFLYSWIEIPPKIGLVSPDYYYVDSPQLKGLFLHSDKNFKKDWSKEKPEIYQEMSDLAHGLHFTSQYLLFNNPKL